MLYNIVIMSNLFYSFFKKIQNLNKNFALLLCFIFLAGIYPSRRFLFEHAILLKLYLGCFSITALYYFIKNDVKKQFVFLLLLLSATLLSFSFSVFSSEYPVRAGSELDIFLGALSLAFLFCLWSQDNFHKNLQWLGGFILLFLHFSACLTLTCARESASFSYPFAGLFLHNFFNPTTLFQLFSLKDFRCPFDYTNYAGLFTVMVFPFFVGLLLAEKNKFIKAVWSISIIYTLLIGYASHGKSCFLLFALECFAFLTLLFIYSKKLSKKCKLFSFISFFLFFGIILAVTPSFRIKILNKLIHTGVKGFLSERYYLAQSGFSLVKDKPYFGHGITTMPLHYLESKPDVIHHCWQLHVAPVQFLFEFGWVGGLFYSSLLLYIIFCGISILRNKTIPTHYRQLTLGCVFSFISYLLFLTESSWDIFAISGFICLIAGIILSVYHKFYQKSPEVCKYGFIYKLAIPIVFIVCLSFSIKDVHGRYYFNEFLEHLTPVTEQQAFNTLKKALQQDPCNLHYLNQAGYYLAHKGYCRNKRSAARAVYFYESSIAINPNQLEILESLGALHIYLGNASRGISYFCDAINCLPSKTATYIQLLDTLKHFNQPELYNQWLGLFTFLRADIVFSQPELVRELSGNEQAQNICLNYYDEIEKGYPNEISSDWKFEKYCREALFKHNFHKLDLKDYNLLKNTNWIKVLNWNALYHFSKSQPKQSRFYYMPLDQHSNMNVLLHGGRGARIKIATLIPIFKPFSSEVCAIAFSYDNKHPRELVAPLIQKTKEWCKTLE